MEGEFLFQFLVIQRDISHALCGRNDETTDFVIHSCVGRLKSLYYEMVSRNGHNGGTPYQLALICLEIVWWGDPDLHDNLEAFAKEVFDLCKEMREDAAADTAAAAAAAAPPTNTRGRKTKGKGKVKAQAEAQAQVQIQPQVKDKQGYSDAILEEVLQHLEALTREALSYLRDQIGRLQRRPQQRKWLDRIRVEALRPHVPPMSGRVEEEPKQLAKRGVKFVVFQEDDDDDADDGDDDEAGDEMELDNSDIEAGAQGVHREEYQTAAAADSSTARKRTRNIVESNRRSYYYPRDSKSSSAATENTPDPRGAIYKRAFARYWNQDPDAWCAMIDRWEEEHGLPGGSRGLVEELQGEKATWE